MRNPACAASLDFASLERLYRRGDVVPRDVVSSVLQRIHAYPDPAVWIHLLLPDEVLQQADGIAGRRRAGEALPLYGVPFAVKDNIDVAGCPTTAGCPAFTYTPARTASVVDRLQNAGALLIGKTNLDQFAAGLAGDRSPYGVCRNVFDPRYISGGSSSGSAVAVASGLVSFALGTDTAGSGRVPAGCNNIVGLKPTRGRLPTDGVVPACGSLDCVSIFALRTDDAFTVCQIATGEPVGLSRRDKPGGSPVRFTFAAPRDRDLEFYGDERQAELFRQALAGLEKLGATRRETVDFGPFQEVASLLYDGPWIAERLAGLEEFVRDHAADMHSVTRSILARGADYSAVDVFKAMSRLALLRRECLKVFKRAEVLVVPTLPTLPTRAEVEADSAGWSRRLGRYTNFVNLLELAALAVPAGFRPDGLPAGVTLIGQAGSERRLCEIGTAWQRWTKLPLGATQWVFPKDEEPVRMEKPSPAAKGMVPRCRRRRAPVRPAPA